MIEDQKFLKKLPTKELQYGENFSEVIPFNKNKLSRNKSKYNQFLRARNLLHMFLLGKRKIEILLILNLQLNILPK